MLSEGRSSWVEGSSSWPSLPSGQSTRAPSVVEHERVEASGQVGVGDAGAVELLRVVRLRAQVGWARGGAASRETVACTTSGVATADDLVLADVLQVEASEQRRPSRVRRSRRLRAALNGAMDRSGPHRCAVEPRRSSWR